MRDRERDITTFLAGAGWDAAHRAPLAGDASARRYQRLSLGAQTAVLMDAPPERGEDTRRFDLVDGWLCDRGYSAPRILAKDHAKGLLLLEDLGDALVARLLGSAPDRERTIYAAATDFLADLHRHPPPAFAAALDGPALAELTALTPEWYLRGIGAPSSAAADTLPGLVRRLHDRLNDAAPVLSLRDFHSENLIWLPDRAGHARLGLLDFQDAVAAHPTYDLVSLLQDARRDLGHGTEQAMIARYAAARGIEMDDFTAIYALLGAQRALRIVGVFARLALRDRKTHYLAFLPRVWAALERNLTHPALAELASAVRAGLPEPTTERIARLAGGSA